MGLPYRVWSFLPSSPRRVHSFLELWLWPVCRSLPRLSVKVSPSTQTCCWVFSQVSTPSPVTLPRFPLSIQMFPMVPHPLVSILQGTQLWRHRAFCLSSLRHTGNKKRALSSLKCLLYLSFPSLLFATHIEEVLPTVVGPQSLVTGHRPLPALVLSCSRAFSSQPGALVRWH